jgi:uncharacterized damage-inducible protein DinB
MSSVMPWFDRVFPFGIPPEQHATERARLRGTPARLEELLLDVPEASLTRKPGGAWSIKEQAGHLGDLEPHWAARLDDFLSGAQTLTAADLTNAKTDRAHHNDRTLGEILATFRAARTAFVERLDRLDLQDFAREAVHPRLRVKIRLVDHLYFVAEHDDHHLAKIWELRRAQP